MKDKHKAEAVLSSNQPLLILNLYQDTDKNNLQMYCGGRPKDNFQVKNLRRTIKNALWTQKFQET